MTRNLKALGLALLAVFAFSAIAAQAASAQTKVVGQDLFTSSEEKTLITGTTEEGTQGKFYTDPSHETEWTCKHANYTGTAVGKAVKEVTLHPEYTECEAPGLAKVTVDTDGCDFVLKGQTAETEATKEVHATTEFECTAGSKMKFTIEGICTLGFGSQTFKDGIAYTNEADKTSGKWNITANVTAKGVVFAKEAPGSFCFLVPGNGKEGILEEQVTIKGYKATKDEVNATTHKWTVTEGEQLDVTVSKE